MDNVHPESALNKMDPDPKSQFLQITGFLTNVKRPTFLFFLHLFFVQK